MRRFPLTLAWQFAIVGALIFGVVGAGTAVVMARVVGDAVTNAALEHSAAEARDIVAGQVIVRLSPEDLEAPFMGTRYQDFDGFVNDSILSTQTPAVNLWGRDGTLIYSSDATGVGQRTEENEELSRALAGRTFASELVNKSRDMLALVIGYEGQ